jgi:Na+/phosphate symporter
MPFNSKTALESWKKAKPLTLTKTGVSELLRDLPVRPTQRDLVKFEQAQKTLKAKMSDPKIQKEKKAHDCITRIHHDIQHYLAGVKQGQALTIECLKRIHSSASRYLDKLEKATDLATAVHSDFFSRGDAAYMNDAAQSTDELTPAVVNVFQQAAYLLRSAREQFVSILKRAKEKKQPDADTLRGMKLESIPKFRIGIQKLQETWKAIEALQ